MRSHRALRTGPRGRRNGVTLAEAVVASVLLAVSILPLLKALTMSQIADRAIERKSVSLMLARQELERIRAWCLYHYDEDYRVSAAAIREEYLCTVADDGDPVLRTVTVSVGLDGDADGLLSPAEVEVSLCTCLARRWPGPP